MAKLSADVAAKWAKNLGGSGESIRKGVNAVTVSPGESAIRQKDAYVQGVARAAAEGKWERGLRRMSLEDWRKAMLDKGLARIATGANQAIPKMEAFLAEWLPYEEALKQQLQSMPRGDLSQNIARAVKAIEYNAAFRRRS